MRELVVVATCDKCGVVGDEGSVINVESRVKMPADNRAGFLEEIFEKDYCHKCLGEFTADARRVPKKTAEKAEAVMEECPICGEEYKKGRGMKRHISQAHPETEAATEAP